MIGASDEVGQRADPDVSLGKRIRLKRVIDPAGASIICALDHGMTSPEFLDPLADVRARTEEAVAGGANVLMLSKGMARFAEPAFRPDTALALLLSASAHPGLGHPEVVAVGEVEEAARLGADAVVLFVALGGEDEPAMIERVAEVGEAYEREGMPFIAEAEFPTTYAAAEELAAEYGFEYLQRNVRLCAELGADIVKTNWPGDGERFASLVAAGGGVPLVLAGGSRITDEELLARMAAAMAAGAIGCSVGRNIFMHERPAALTRALARVIRERWRVDDALAELAGVPAA
jgi:fructose-bisphosphate aldolase / 2-amino-3,7-dideoxy-D-threo-hept-6-ulosonate synthase